MGETETPNAAKSHEAEIADATKGMNPEGRAAFEAELWRVTNLESMPSIPAPPDSLNSGDYEREDSKIVLQAREQIASHRAAVGRLKDEYKRAIGGERGAQIRTPHSILTMLICEERKVDSLERSLERHIEAAKGRAAREAQRAFDNAPDAVKIARLAAQLAALTASSASTTTAA